MFACKAPPFPSFIALLYAPPKFFSPGFVAGTSPTAPRARLERQGQAGGRAGAADQVVRISSGRKGPAGGGVDVGTIAIAGTRQHVTSHVDCWEGARSVVVFGFCGP